MISIFMSIYFYLKELDFRRNVIQTLQLGMGICYFHNTICVPILVHDIYIGDEFYGENVLHMAIANEDDEMVKFILEEGKKVLF